jgi:hypothetical protein
MKWVDSGMLVVVGDGSVEVVGMKDYQKVLAQLKEKQHRLLDGRDWNLLGSEKCKSD